MKARGIITVEYSDMSMSEAGIEEQRLKDICKAIKLTTPNAVQVDAIVKERRGDAGIDLTTAKFRTS